MTGPRVVIIGAGVVGAALADELSARGWTTSPSSTRARARDRRLLLARPRTGVPDQRVQDHDRDGPLHRREARLPRPRRRACFLQVGGLEVATTPNGSPSCTAGTAGPPPGASSRACSTPPNAPSSPPARPRRVLGGLHVPTDGLAKAVRAVEAQLRRARSRGVRLLDRHEVLDVRTDGRVAGVVTDQGEIPADVVVCCAGIWGPKVAGMVGMPLPLTPLAHQLAWTGPGARPGGTRRGGDRCRSCGTRTPTSTTASGSTASASATTATGRCRSAPRTCSVDAAEVMPSVMTFTPEDFEDAWTETQRLLPGTRAAKLDEGINGLFSFTTDNMPLIGRVARVSRASGWPRRSG